MLLPITKKNALPYALSNSLFFSFLLLNLSACGTVESESGPAGAGGLGYRIGATAAAREKSAASTTPPETAARTGCAAKTVRCVGPGEEYDTGGVTHVETVLQQAVDSARPGDTIKLRGGVYRHNPDSRSNFFLSVAVDGRKDAPIVIEAFDGEAVVFEGFGFSDDAPRPARQDERLIDVTGDYIHIRNLELAHSSRWGLVINGNHGRYENLVVRDTWGMNVAIRADDAPVEGNVIRYVESYRARHGTGIALVTASGRPQIIRDNTIEYSLSHHNGYQPNGKIVPAVPGDAVGGGNSDGIGSFKSCHDDRNKFGMNNICPNNIFRGNIVWHNADDGFDVSFAHGSALIDNIAFDNGPQGNKGYKVYSRVVGGLNFIGNIAMSQPSFGFEIQFEDAGLVYHNTSVRNRSAALSATAFHPLPGKARLANNLAAYSSSHLRDGNGFVKLTNHWQDRDGDPKLADPHFDASTVDDSGAAATSVAEKWAAIRRQFLRALAPAADSPLIDAGTLISGVHCERADDDPNHPMPTGADCRHWKGKAPDIGAVEYGG